MPKSSESEQGFESRLLPILREGVDVVKMVFFLRLRGVLGRDSSIVEPTVIPRLAGAVINELFGTPNPDPDFAAFRIEHAEIIEKVLNDIPATMQEMCIPLSDALRVVVLCDHQESGCDGSAVLSRAQDLGVLLTDRDLPLPHRFLDLVRRLGKAHGLVMPPVPEKVAPEG
jgi:hypothetical protein